MLSIEYESRRVGKAIDVGEKFALEYDPNWLEFGNAFPVSVSLPLREERWPADLAHPFFANLLPEGRARESICRQLGISVEDDVALLTALGDDTAGAFRFRTHDGERSDEERRAIPSDDLARWSKGRPALLSHPAKPARLSLAGAQHKTTVVLDDGRYAIPGSDEASTHILKFDSEQFAHLSGNEFITTRFAKELGVDVVSSRLDDENAPRPFLVVTRYDRLASDTRVRRLHQEDFCQVFGLPRTRKYQEYGGPSLAAIAEKLREISAAPAADIYKLVRWVIFCAISGNADGHAKNLSMLYSPSGRRLAPAYDLVCTHAYADLDRGLAFSVGGRRDPDRLRRAEWTQFADDIGVRPRLIFGELERMLSEAPIALDAACDAAGDNHARLPVSRAVQKRIRALRGNLGQG